MDISYDSTIICTGSADRNVKIWGLDFGDCHKSIFAHDDSVKSLKFVPKTHYFFTCGKDGLVKQWDADNYERIMTIEVALEQLVLKGPLLKYFLLLGSPRSSSCIRRVGGPRRELRS